MPKRKGQDVGIGLSVAGAAAGGRLRPLDRATVTGDGAGTWVVRDGQGREYVRRRGTAPFSFTVGGALGRHEVRLLDGAGNEQAAVSFAVDARTALSESSGVFAQLFSDAAWTMISWNEAHYLRIGNRIYHYFHFCHRDNVHVMKGMKYFWPELKEGLDLFTDTQRADGMIWDTVKPSHPYPTYWDMVFSPAGFAVNDPRRGIALHRTPVEADLEYLYVEGLYYIWKATGDEAWMRGRLDNAVRALAFSRRSPYYWSRRFGLVKRGYTIDTWDYQAQEDAARTGGTMSVDPRRTRFGVMHGDNTGYAAACGYLAEMLGRVGRAADARRWAAVGRDVRRRLDRVAWNGDFFTHHVPEDPRVKRDLGVDEASQVSLSNAYALNRGLPHAQCVRILRTYQRIRRRMPRRSPGEWYLIYPPFERGFGHVHGKWEYMNGGVSTITAGELAHGAFGHGFEAYGADILRRVGGLCDRYAEHLERIPAGGSAPPVSVWGRQRILPCVLRGASEPPPPRSFAPLPLRAVANTDLAGAGAPGVPGWTGEGDNDLAGFPVGRRVYEGVPFAVIDPARNGRRACLGVSVRPGYARVASLSVGRKAASVYLLHTYSGRDYPAGALVWVYADGTEHRRAIDPGLVTTWWTPPDFFHPKARVAWRGRNARCPNVAVFVCGIDNPHPDRRVDELRFEAAPSGGLWFVLGATASDAPAYFTPGPMSFGIPEDWGAAAVMYALVEGLAGVKDGGVAFDRLRLSPRWAAAGVQRAEVTVRYPASDGYAAYRYRAAGRALTVTFTGSAAETRVEVLLPAGRRSASVRLDGRPVTAHDRTVERSVYACVDVTGVGVHRLQIETRSGGRRA